VTDSAPAFADVAQRVAPRLLRIARHMCGSPQDAEDLVQDTLLQGFRKWSQFEGRSDPATWLYTIASRLCRRRHRRRAGEPARIESLTDLLPIPADALPMLPTGEGPDAARMRDEAERAVRRAIAVLPQNVRLPFVLSEIAELSTSEIARILGLKEPTVKTRVHRARLRVRKALIEGLPAMDGPPPDHDRQVCLDLLQAKQDALDRHAEFPLSPQELCERCRSVFATLDFGRQICQALEDGTLPPAVRELLQQGS
jgi:RNA polymerase sigma-70 factor (ECF subfamily)